MKLSAIRWISSLDVAQLSIKVEQTIFQNLPEENKRHFILFSQDDMTGVPKRFNYSLKTI